MIFFFCSKALCVQKLPLFRSNDNIGNNNVGDNNVGGNNVGDNNVGESNDDKIDKMLILRKFGD